MSEILGSSISSQSMKDKEEDKEETITTVKEMGKMIQPRKRIMEATVD